MDAQTTKLTSGFLLLVGIWIGVYWWWEPAPPIRFASTLGAERAEVPPRAPGMPDSEAAPSDPPPAPTPRQPNSQEPNPRPDPAPDATGKPTSLPETPARGGESDRGASAAPRTRLVAVPPEMMPYVIRPNDTLSTISRRVYGTAAHAAAISRANPLLTPDRLRPGREILVPKDPTNIQGRVIEVPVEADATPPARGEETDSAPRSDARTYVVRPGDSLSRIAQRVYGRSSLADLIFEANRGVLNSPDELKPGMVLAVPPDPAATPARQ